LCEPSARRLATTVSQPVAGVPPGVGGWFKRGTQTDIKNLTSLSRCNLFIVSITTVRGSLVSSGSTVSDYGLDDGVRSPAGAKDFSSSLCVQTGCGAHPASCTMGTGGPSPGVKRGRGVMLTTHLHLVQRSWMSRSYTSSPLKRLHGV
jgi:hypothetical protein